MSTTYSGQTNSKSINARVAERNRRFSATQMAAYLRSRGLFRGITGSHIKSAVKSYEWHHVGTYAAEVDYYGLEDIYRDRAALRAAIAQPRAPRDTAERIEGCAVQWTDWVGKSRNYMRPLERRFENVAVTLKGNWAIVHTSSLGDVRKKLNGSSFRLTLPKED